MCADPIRVDRSILPDPATAARRERLASLRGGVPAAVSVYLPELTADEQQAVTLWILTADEAVAS